LAAVGYPGPPIETGVIANPVDTTNGLAKLDYNVSNRDRLSVRYTMYDARSSNARNAGGINTPSASAGLDNTDQTLAVGNVMTLSTRTVLETRAQFATSDLKAPPSDPIGPAVTISGVAAFGTLSGAPTARTNRLFEVANNLSYLAGAHSLRAGANVLYNDLDITFPRSYRGAYTFQNLANFLLGTYNNSGFTQTFGESVVRQTNPNLGIYAQDSWRVNDRLTLDGGLRYDLQWLDTIETDTNNVSPRAGFAWTIRADDAKVRYTVLRGSAGLFFDRVPLRAVANALLSAGNTTDTVSFARSMCRSRPHSPARRCFRTSWPASCRPRRSSISRPSIRASRMPIRDRRASRSSINSARRGSVSVGYEHLRGFNLLMQINQNVPTCAASGNNNGCRPNRPTPITISIRRPAVRSTTACHVAVQQRFSTWADYRASYTYSKSFNNVGEAFFNSPIDPTDLSKDWGRSDDDMRHKVVVSGSVHSSSQPAASVWDHLSHGFMLSGVWQYYSSLPFNITSGVTTIQGTAGRPIVDGEFIPRNAWRGRPVLEREPAREPPVPRRLPHEHRSARRSLQPFQHA
jgi:hypothetical protein